MSVYRPKNSPFYQYDFWLGGRRFLRTTEKTRKRDAEIVEAERKAQARIEIAAQRQGEAQLAGRIPLTLDVAAGRWWVEVGQFRADAKDCWRSIERMLTWFGKDRRLDVITDPDIARWVAERRGERVWGKAKLKNGEAATLVAPATVNRTTVDALRRLYGRARKKWKLVYANEPDWSEHRLAEPEERTRELEAHEQEALNAAGRKDYEPLYRFARLSGLRKKTCLIKKTDVKWHLGRIEVQGKGKKINRVPLSAPIRAVLLECWDDHPEYVFTYIAQRTHGGKVKGKRYPITKSGLTSQWKDDRKRAAVTAPSVIDFRFHDNRHTAATRILRASKNLKIAQKLLNHSRITTTAKYAHVLDDEVLDAMNATPDHDAKSRRKSRTAKPKVA